MPLLVAVAAVTAIGWIASAAAMAGTIASGHAIAAAAGALTAAALVLPVVDIVTAIGSLARRASRPAPPRRPGRAIRKTARRARNANGGRPAALPTLRRWLRRLCVPSVFASLPRPVCWALTVATWTSVTAFAWVTVWTWSHGGVPFGDAGAPVRGQQVADGDWMIHLIVWCGLACRRLNRSRAAQRMLPSVHPNAST